MDYPLLTQARENPGESLQTSSDKQTALFEKDAVSSWRFYFNHCYLIPDLNSAVLLMAVDCPEEVASDLQRGLTQSLSWTAHKAGFTGDAVEWPTHAAIDFPTTQSGTPSIVVKPTDNTAHLVTKALQAFMTEHLATVESASAPGKLGYLTQIYLLPEAHAALLLLMISCPAGIAFDLQNGLTRSLRWTAHKVGLIGDITA